MLVMIPCMECLVQDGAPDGYALITYQDSGRYEFTCVKGHTTVTILQNQRFEVLFDIAANAINDGYYRESVTSFASSREHFYEFIMRVLLLKMHPGRSELFADTWRPIGAQSERQLGAFITTWAAHYGEVPSLLSQPEVKFRNDVIHKGKIPTRSEAIQFGQRVLDLAREQIAKLQSDCEEEISKETLRHLRAARISGDDERRVSTGSAPSIIGLHIARTEKNHSRTLEEALVQIAEWRETLQEIGRHSTLAQIPTYDRSGNPIERCSDVTRETDL